MSTLDARDLRRGLRVLSHALNRVGDWRRRSSREHLELGLKAADKALVNAHGGDHLAEAAAHLLLALEQREQRAANHQPPRSTSKDEARLKDAPRGPPELRVRYQ